MIEIEPLAKEITVSTAIIALQNKVNELVDVINILIQVHPRVEVEYRRILAQRDNKNGQLR